MGRGAAEKERDWVGEVGVSSPLARSHTHTGTATRRRRRHYVLLLRHLLFHSLMMMIKRPEPLLQPHTQGAATGQVT